MSCPLISKYTHFLFFFIIFCHLGVVVVCLPGLEMVHLHVLPFIEHVYVQLKWCQLHVKNLKINLTATVINVQLECCMAPSLDS